MKTKLLTKMATNIINTPTANRVRKHATNYVTKKVTDWFLRNGVKMITKEFMVTLEMNEAQNRTTYHNFLRWLKNHVESNRLLSGLQFENELFTLSAVPTVFKYQDHWFYVTQRVNTENKDYHIATINMLGRETKVMENLYNEFRQKQQAKKTTDDEEEYEYVEINVYKSTQGGDWDHQCEIHPRRFETIVMTQDVKADLMNKLEHFKKSESFYKDRGFPYKLGLILHGEPGTGKTSIIKAIATYLNYDIYELNFRHVNNENILSCLRKTSRDSIIVIEEFDACGKIADISARDGINELYKSDVDNIDLQILDEHGMPIDESIEVSRYEQNMSPQGKRIKGHFDKKNPLGQGYTYQAPRLELGELLKSFDGLIPLDNRVIIMTSNMFKKMEIDPALTRRGRIDAIYELRKFETPEVYEYAEKMFPNNKMPEGLKFEPILGCDIQEYFLDNKFDFNKFVQALPKASDCPLLTVDLDQEGKPVLVVGKQPAINN